jgi:NitT/TauT family transport system permease protein/sulfonate transport system permease protein
MAHARTATFAWDARATKIAAAHLFTLAVLGAWWAVARVVPPFLLPGPVEVAAALWAFVTTPRLLAHMLASFAHVGIAIALSFAIGFALAQLPTYVPVFRLAIHHRLTPFLNSFSGVGWTLLAVMWFGVTPTTVVFSISAVLIPFALVNLAEGLASLDRETLEMAQSFTRSRLRRFLAITLPALAPFMFATVRIMFGVAWKVTLTAELFGGNSGFGYLINLARQEFDTTTIFVCIILIVAFVYATDRLVFAPLQARLARRYGTA